MKRAVCFSIMLVVLLSASSADAQHYYTLDGQIPLNVDSLRVLIKLDEPWQPDRGLPAVLSSIDRIVALIEDDLVIDSFICCSLSTGIGYNKFLDSLDTLDGIYLVEPYYRYAEDAPMLVGDRFIVAFDRSLSSGQIDSINAERGVVMDKLIYGFESIYALRNTDSSGMRVLDLANYFHNMDIVHFAHPEFGMMLTAHGYNLYDFYHNQQDQLKKVIGDFNQNTVWDFAGWDDTVIVALMDEKLMPHEDLPASRILPSRTWVPEILQNPVNAHGIACAGIIGASHTTNSNYANYPFTGIISMNPNVKFLPAVIREDHVFPYSPSAVAEAYNWVFENDVDVVANSWGFKYCIGYPVIDTAIIRLYYNGRDGLGTPVIFSSGNDSLHEVSWPGCMDCCIAVGAVDLLDARYEYSNYGWALDLVAPSADECVTGFDHVWTLDLMDIGGINPYGDVCGNSITWNCEADYNCHFGGTSAASPIVSGIASLLIARDPTLTVDEIYDVLKFSAVTDLDWGTINPPDYEYGWGRADAYRAMLAIARGDANNDADLNVGDAVYTIAYIFKGGDPPQPHLGTADANCDGTINAADVVYMVNFIFKGGPEPPLCYEYDY